MKRRWWAPAVGAAVLVAVVLRTGAGPFLDGVGSLDPPSLVLGVLIAVPTTLACAWRWHLVAGGLGVRVGVRPAVAACYRAQFLNTVLPGGVLVHGFSSTARSGPPAVEARPASFSAAERSVPRLRRTAPGGPAR